MNETDVVVGDVAKVFACRRAAKRIVLERPGLHVVGNTYTGIHQCIRVRLFLVLAEGLDSDHHGEADDDNAKHKKEKLLLAHSSGELRATLG